MLLLLLLLLLLLGTGSVVRAEDLPGDYFPITNIKDPYVQEMGEFAVKEYNRKSKAELKFVKVLKGKSQIVAGTNYALLLAAENGSFTSNFVAVVYEDLEHAMYLSSFVNHVLPVK